jgi:BAAT / Acyl-CoA thioester hydrolase C terminal.
MSEKVETNNIVISEQAIKDHTSIFIRKEKSVHNPIIFVYHKLMEEKENELRLGYYIAKQGYFVILVDTPMHGPDERRQKYEFNKVLSDIKDTVFYTQEIIAFLSKQNYDLNFHSIGAVGSSIGATIALMAGVLLESITYVGCLIGTCNLETVFLRHGLDSFKLYSKSQPVIDYQQILEEFPRFNIFNLLHQDNMKPVIFLDGKLDLTVPIKDKYKFYEKLKELYRSENKEDLLYFLEYKNAGHFVTNQMINDLIKWLNDGKWNSCERNLLPIPECVCEHHANGGNNE